MVYFQIFQAGRGVLNLLYEIGPDGVVAREWGLRSVVYYGVG